MTSVTHATFVVERTYDAAPSRVFAAWSEPEAKARWFGGSDGEFELDFRVGGREFSRGGPPDGPPTRSTVATRTSFPTSGSSMRTRCSSMTGGSRSH